MKRKIFFFFFINNCRSMFQSDRVDSIRPVCVSSSSYSYDSSPSIIGFIWDWIHKAWRSINGDSSSISFKTQNQIESWREREEEERIEGGWWSECGGGAKLRWSQAPPRSKSTEEEVDWKSTVFSRQKSTLTSSVSILFFFFNLKTPLYIIQ